MFAVNMIADCNWKWITIIRVVAKTSVVTGPVPVTAVPIVVTPTVPSGTDQTATAAAVRMKTALSSDSSKDKKSKRCHQI